jgi:hypothetical protein
VDNGISNFLWITFTLLNELELLMHPRGQLRLSTRRWPVRASEVDPPIVVNLGPFHSWILKTEGPLVYKPYHSYKVIKKSRLGQFGRARSSFEISTATIVLCTVSTFIILARIAVCVKINGYIAGVRCHNEPISLLPRSIHPLISARRIASTGLLPGSQHT